MVSLAAPPPTIPPRADWRLHLGVLALFTVLTAIMTWPLARGLWWSSLDTPTYGDTLSSAYWLSWQAHALITNPLHLLDTNTLYPFTGTLAYDELSFGPALFAAPIFWLTNNSMLAFNLVVFSTFVLAGYSAWLLGRTLTGSGWVGLVAGVAYAFSSYRFDHLNHITLLSGQWLPLMLLCLHRLWGLLGERGVPPVPVRRVILPAAGFALFFTLQCYGSHYYAFYTILTVAAFALYYPLVTQRLAWRFWGVMGGAGLLGAAALAPIALGYLQVQAAYSFARPLWDAQRYSNSLESFLAVWRGNPLYRALLAPFADPGPWPWERSAFPGLVPLGLGLVALVAGGGWLLQRRGHVEHANVAAAINDARLGTPPATRHIGFYALLALGAVILSLGPDLHLTFDGAAVLPLPYRFLYDWVPGVQSMRAVTRIGLVWTLGLSLLAAFGFQWLLRRIGSGPVAVRRVPLLAGGACLLLLVETWSAPVPMLPLPTGASTPPVYQWLAGQPRQVTMEYPMVYRERGPLNVALNTQYLYYATHWQPLINGDYTLKPTAYTALQFETESCFPCPRSLDALWALDVRRVVVHLDSLSGAQQDDFLWRADPSHIPATGLAAGEFTLIQDFNEVKVYALGPRPLAGLRDQLPPGASLALAAKAGDPAKLGAYTAALGWWLRDHRQYGDPEYQYGQPLLAWTPGTRTDAAILYQGQDPAPYGFAPGEVAWQNNHVVLYVHR